MHESESRHRVVRGAVASIIAFIAAGPVLAQQPAGKPAKPSSQPSGAPAASSAASVPGPGDVRGACQFGYENGQIARREGRLLDARRYLAQCSQSYCPSFVRSDCAEWHNDAVAMTPTVVIEARSAKGDEPNVKVTVDGRVVATQLDGKPIELDPGLHAFRFERAPWPAVEEKVLLVASVKGRMLAVRFDASDAPARPAKDAAPSSSSSGVPTSTYVLAGAGLLLAANAAYWGVTCLSDNTTLY